MALVVVRLRRANAASWAFVVNILSRGSAIAINLSVYGGYVNADMFSDFFFGVSFCSKAKIADLCSEVSCLYFTIQR